MHHNISLITTIASAFGVALILGFIAEQIKLPTIVGYLMAGILIGPATPGFVADAHIASQLSEIGIMLLMFGAGLHFSVNDLLAVKRIAIPGAIIQMGFATLLGIFITWHWGWPIGSGLVFGLTLSCASTVVLIKALEAQGLTHSLNGRIVIGWLVVEDLITVMVLVLLPVLSNLLGGSVQPDIHSHSIWLTIARKSLEVGTFIALMLIVGRRLLPWLLWQVARTGSRELFTLSVVATAIGIAYGASELFSVSFALGAFFAGMVMRESEFSHRAAEESLPLRDIFSVLFFVSVGMLFDPAILIQQPMHVLEVVAIIIMGKAIIATLLVMAFGYPLMTALMIAASLAQIGEFSFILAVLGLSLGLLPPEGMPLILAGALISIALNPFLFALIKLLEHTMGASAQAQSPRAERGDPYTHLSPTTDNKYLQGQVILVGYGRVGRIIATTMDNQQIPYVVAEQNEERVKYLHHAGVGVVSGNATDSSVLMNLHIADAAILVITISDMPNTRKIAKTARRLNPDIAILLSAQSEQESVLLRNEDLGKVFFGEEELAQGMARHISAYFVHGD